MLILGITCRFLQLQQMLLLLSIMAMATSHATAASSLSTAARGGDEAALVAFKGKISNAGSSLATWNESTSYCSWEGVTCSTRHQQRVVSLYLSSQGLAGTISPAIGNLTFLRSLNLSSNSLQGEIPPSIGSLRRLQSFDLTNNTLTGGIPSNISRCTSLRVMVIGRNPGLRGSIPAEIGNMPSLSMLGLFHNSFTGTIPPSFGNLSRLTKLSLATNYLEGSILPGIGNNPNLKFLSLCANNLSGLVPASLYNLSSLNVLCLEENELHGRLPSDLGKNLPSIQIIMLTGNRFIGALPLSLTNLSSLQYLNAEANGFTGVVPSEIGRLRNLNALFLGSNIFEANKEEEWEFIASLTNCSGLQQLAINSNRFAGKLPSSLANLTTNLQLLDIENNYICGTIPPDIGNLASLQMINFISNMLTGDIPESIGKLTQLDQLHLNSNNLSGLIPFSIGNLTSLSYLNANDNNLAGPIPSSIGNWKQVSFLGLGGNKLTGLIPKGIMELSSLSIGLDLSYNLLEGPVPSGIGNLVNLEQLLLSGKKLSDEIPDTIGNLRVMQAIKMDDNSFQGSIPTTFKNVVGLTYLNLTSNKLNGSIPGNIASITNLKELHLSHNNFSGTIPALLGNSTSLLVLNLSFNNLQGEVPTEGIFRNLSGLSIVGNNALCGGIPELYLPKCTKATVGKKIKSMPRFLRIVIPVAGAIMILLSGLAFAGFCYKRSKVGLKKHEQSLFKEIDLPMVPYNDILKGTDGFSEANVLGKGRYGTVYRGTLENQAIPVAVKVFNLQQSGSYKSFMVECEALRRVRHRCLVKIITCCSSINHQCQDFRALVFEFMANGSLDRWIHSNFEAPNEPRALSLSQRLDIAVDIVDALDYLHNGCQPPVIHCDLKPSNILLDQDMRARVGDFGIAKILDEATSTRPTNSNSSIGIRGSIGYIAPEYGEGLAVSTYGDVYSLGVTLIEMFTGRSPTDDMLRDGLNLHCFAAASLPDKVMEIANSNIWLQDGVNTRNDTRHMTRIKKCLSSVIQLGVLLSKQLPIERLSMSNAAAEMHAIRDAYSTTQQ